MKTRREIEVVKKVNVPIKKPKVQFEAVSLAPRRPKRKGQFEAVARVPQRPRSERTKHLQFGRNSSVDITNNADDDGETISGKEEEHLVDSLMSLSRREFEKNIRDDLCVDKPQDDLSGVEEVSNNNKDNSMVSTSNEEDLSGNGIPIIGASSPKDRHGEGSSIPSSFEPISSTNNILCDSQEKENMENTIRNNNERLFVPLDSPSCRTRGKIRKLCEHEQMPPIVEENILVPNEPTQQTSNDVRENVNVDTAHVSETSKKNTRGPAKMKMVVETDEKVDIIFNEYGQPIGEASIGMASFLGLLVREVVPVTLQDWRKLSTRLREILWASIQSRYNVNEGWHKNFFFQKMGRLWRAGKSRIVTQIQNALTDEDRLKLKPDNIHSMDDWLDFVKEKTSVRFKVRSEKFRTMKKKQLPHTCSRKGYARLADEMKKSSSDPSSITRVKLWAEAHKKKDGQPVNPLVAETLERIEQTETEIISPTDNVVDDAMNNAIGPKHGHSSRLGFGVTRPKFAVLPKKDNRYTKLEEEHKKMKDELMEMKFMMSQLINSQGQTSEQHESIPITMVSLHMSMNNKNALRKCKLLDWCGSGEVVAEGRWSSNDPKALVHNIPLGPLAVKVWVDVPRKHEAYLWRPTSEITTIEDAVGSTIAWPSDKIIMKDEHVPSPSIIFKSTDQAREGVEKESQLNPMVKISRGKQEKELKKGSMKKTGFLKKTQQADGRLEQKRKRTDDNDDSEATETEDQGESDNGTEESDGHNTEGISSSNPREVNDEQGGKSGCNDYETDGISKQDEDKDGDVEDNNVPIAMKTRAQQSKRPRKGKVS